MHINSKSEISPLIIFSQTHNTAKWANKQDSGLQHDVEQEHEPSSKKAFLPASVWYN
jgi:hypothetical protein